MALHAIKAGIQLPEGPLDRYIELSHLRHLLRNLDINCVLDVGANLGQFASELRSIGYRGRIVSFEPVEHAYITLSQRFAGDDEWQGYKLALGSKNEDATINVHPLSGMSSLLEWREGDRRVEPEEIEVRRLDSLFPDLIGGIERPRIFLKMDTQGYDLEVFRGAADCAAAILGLQSELSIRPLYENMPHYLEALKRFEEAGFRMHNLSVVNRVRDGGLLELNCFMTR